MTKQSIIDAINTRIGQTSYGAWRIGLTYDPAGDMDPSKTAYVYIF